MRAKMAELSVVGKSIPRVDAMDKATGSVKFAYDMKLPGMLYGKVLRSPHPHAKIVSIDTSKAERVKGVMAVVCGRDASKVLFGDYLNDQTFLAVDKVRFVGEPIAAVAASDEEIAEDALSLIEVDYEELEPIYDPEKALEEKTNLIHERLGEYKHSPVASPPLVGTNICSHAKIRRGDINQGFREAFRVYEHRFTTQMVQHCCLEPHVVIADVNSSGKITVYGSFQSPFITRSTLAHIFQVPVDKVRVIAPPVGGAFGSKTRIRLEPIAVSLAQKASRPVKMIMTREEEFIGSVVRHPAIIYVRTGVTSEGKLIARKVTITFDTGAYGDDGPYVAEYAATCAAGPYQIANVWIDSYSVYTNKPVAGAMRGFGNPQVHWASEYQMDIMAEDLGIDPIEMRLKNAAEEGTIHSSTGEVLHSVGLKETIRNVTDAIEWKREPSSGRGIGIACAHHFIHPYSGSMASVKVDDEGSVKVFIGAQEIGQGINTVVTQIAAEVLGISPARISVVTPDTDISPWDFATVSSRETFFSGNAVKLAAEDAKRQLIDLAIRKLRVDPDDLICADGRIFIRAEPERGCSFKELFLYDSSCGNNSIIGKAEFDLTTPPGRPTPWMYATQAAEVEVDRETGSVKVIKVISAHDVGKAINPAGCEQQIEGGIVMGIGHTLFEELVLHSGKVLNDNFTDYKIPVSKDIPELVPIIVEVPHKEGPFGAKGIAELSLVPTAPAIANAIYNAVGVRIQDMPITPEKIVSAIKQNMGAGTGE